MATTIIPVESTAISADVAELKIDTQLLASTILGFKDQAEKMRIAVEENTKILEKLKEYNKQDVAMSTETDKKIAEAISLDIPPVETPAEPNKCPECGDCALHICGKHECNCDCCDYCDRPNSECLVCDDCEEKVCRCECCEDCEESPCICCSECGEADCHYCDDCDSPGCECSPCPECDSHCGKCDSCEEWNCVCTYHDDCGTHCDDCGDCGERSCVCKKCPECESHDCEECEYCEERECGGCECCKHCGETECGHCADCGKINCKYCEECETSWCMCPCEEKEELTLTVDVMSPQGAYKVKIIPSNLNCEHCMTLELAGPNTGKHPYMTVHKTDVPNAFLATCNQCHAFWIQDRSGWGRAEFSKEGEGKGSSLPAGIMGSLPALAGKSAMSTGTVLAAGAVMGAIGLAAAPKIIEALPYFKPFLPDRAREAIDGPLGQMALSVAGKTFKKKEEPVQEEVVEVEEVEVVDVDEKGRPIKPKVSTAEKPAPGK